MTSFQPLEKDQTASSHSRRIVKSRKREEKDAPVSATLPQLRREDYLLRFFSECLSVPTFIKPAGPPGGGRLCRPTATPSDRRHLRPPPCHHFSATARFSVSEPAQSNPLTLWTDPISRGSLSQIGCQPRETDALITTFMNASPFMFV